MNDLLIAREHLAGHTLCLCKDGECLFSEKRGIAPMMEFAEAGADLLGYSAADIVVGKAAAFLFVRSGIKAVFAKTLSVSAKNVLEAHGIFCEYETLTEHIIDRTGKDICPMEKAVRDCNDADEAYLLLKAELQARKASAHRPEE